MASKFERGQKLRVGILGCGVIAETHLPYVRKAGGDVVGVADLSLARSNEIADRFGVQRTYPNAEELLEIEKPDVVHVLTPPHTHCAVACEALKRGVHVLVEKPMALTSAEVETMGAAAAESGAKLTVDHNRLFDPPMLAARALHESGALGDVVAVESFQAGAASERAWLPQVLGGGLGDLLPHPLYLQLAFMDEVGDIRAHAFNPRGDQEPEELRVAMQGKRCSGSLTLSMNASPHLNTLKLYGTKMTVEVNLNNMTLIRRRDYDLPKVIAKSMPNLDESYQLLSQTIRNTWNFVTGKVRYYPGMGVLIQRFYESIRCDGVPPVSLEQAAEVVRVTGAIWKAIGVRPGARQMRAVG